MWIIQSCSVEEISKYIFYILKKHFFSGLAMKNTLTNSTPTLDAKEASFYVFFFLFTVLKST